MIKVGDVITMWGYDYDLCRRQRKKWKVLQIFPNFVLCENVKAKYRECFGMFDLIENGYIPNFEDVKDEAIQPRHTTNYGASNKLLQEYHA